jgi:V/A-type H+-transporting ATPase subunit I
MIAKMRLVNLTVEESQLDDLLSKFIDYSGFHPVEAQQIVSSVHGARSYEMPNPAEGLLQEIKEIEQEVGMIFIAPKTRQLTASLDEMHQYLVDSHQVFSGQFNRIKQLEADIKRYKEALQQIENIEGFDISFEDLFHAKFVSLRFGKLPLDSVERLRFYRHKPFIFMPLHEDKEKHELWCLYLMANEYEREIDNLFTSMYFERIHIPDFVSGTPGSAMVALRGYIGKCEKEIEIAKQELQRLASDYQEGLSQTKGEIEFLYKMYDAKKYVVGLGDRVSISGFIEKSKVDEFEAHFKMIPSIEIDVRPATSDKRLKPPTKLKNNWFTRPFQVFVEMYGMPTYGDIDPTTFMAITYTLLFGIMFGDVGQGLLVALIGFLLGKFKNWSLGPILVRVGFSGAFFGLLYGEIFGNEEILHHFYQEILHIDFLPFVAMDPSNTMTLLFIAIGLGAIILFTAIILNTIYKFKKKDYAEAICSPNGVSGMILYGFTLTTIVTMVLGINILNIFTVLTFIVIPVLLIFFKEPIHRKFHHEVMFPDGIGGFITEGFFELFEVILSYVTNTLSFMRVGGFVLSHAGLMLVVKVLAGADANPIVMALGNLFVMGLEGLIVGIQVLRLEFYEMFSRYYDGDGFAFNPIVNN